MSQTVRKLNESLLHYCSRIAALSKRFGLSEMVVEKNTRDGLNPRYLRLLKPGKLIVNAEIISNENVGVDALNVKEWYSYETKVEDINKLLDLMNNYRDVCYKLELNRLYRARKNED
ncbi:unnamed protein product [Ceratitis capitata]|uniref:(Mediterranean fruit fly) hypothetical protein n=1 Tax=Ceratitis capitata TaxID=7213 RepID=A0A811USJ2_CERCA|nr:unnamed protein product [Ceratitis capitata]